MEPGGNSDPNMAAIRVSGPDVLATLTQACSQDATILKPAEQRLHSWETQPGFYTILQAIFADHSIDVNVRWLAVVLFKNGVDRFWRKNAPHAIPEEEKETLRSKLVATFNEPVGQVATQIAVLISKIARYDCPRSWPQLIPILAEAVRVEDALCQQRALLTFYHVTKVLASKRLMHDRKLFEELALNVFEYMMNLWNGHTQAFQQNLLNSSGDPAVTVSSLDKSILALKVLRKLVVHGFKDLEQTEWSVTFISQVFQSIEQFVKAKHQMQSRCLELVTRREKMINLLTKVLLDVLETHPDFYVQFIQSSLHLAVTYNFTDSGTGLLFERFTVNTFNLIRGILKCESYRPARSVEETKNPRTLEAHEAKMKFFTVDTLTEICRRLVAHYFLLTQEELHSWDSDPEEFIGDEGGDSWKFSIRPCTEQLYLTLFREFRENLTPVVVNLVQHVEGSSNPDDLQALLQKDAVYNAVGLASFDLFDEINFDDWFQSHLLAELKVSHTNYRIIRRRVIWLVGCWIGVKFSASQRHLLYEAILPLLQPTEDMVVRIEAAATLKVAVDDFEFRTEDFGNFLEPSFSLLFLLLKDAFECETKMHILHVMSFVIERVGVEIRPYVSSLLQYLPLLWQESEEHNMLRCAILTTLSNLVQGVGTMCVAMYDILLPVIKFSTDASQPPHVYLMEDGLDLWLMTLHSSPAITPGLLELFTNIPELYDVGSDTLRICIKITEAYLLLGPTEFLEEYSRVLVTSLSSLLTDLRSEGIVMVLKVIEMVLRLFPGEGPSVFELCLPQFFKALMEEEHYPMETSLYICICGRIVLQNNQYYFSFLDKMAAQFQCQSSELLSSHLDAWLEKSENLIHSERKKLSAMALCSLLPLNLNIVLERFASIINVALEALHDICRLEGNQQLDVLVMSDSSDLSEAEETEHDKRKRRLSLQDPIHSINLKDYVQQTLTRCQTLYGQSTFTQLMESVDPDVLQQLQDFVSVV